MSSPLPPLRAGLLLPLLALAVSWPAPGAAPAAVEPSCRAMPADPELLGRLGPEKIRRLEREATPVEMYTTLHEERAKSAFDKVSGTGSCLIVLWEFADHPADQAAHPASAYDELIFSTGTHPTGSMNDFFIENSYGQFSVAGDVIGWTVAANDYFSYAGPDSVQNATTCREMLRDAIAELDPYVDFAQYDNDGPDGIPDSGDDDGAVDAFFFVHAGPGEESTGDPKDIWSHAWYLGESTSDGVIVGRYSVEPEELPAGDLMTFGVFAHEYGHVLGLPDLYDTDYSSSGIGEWGLMSGGSWNRRAGDLAGSSPAHLSAWCKKELGWLAPTPVTATTPGVSIPPAETAAVAYRIFRDGATGGDEYFLIENRRRLGFDEGLVRRQINHGLPAPEGLIIYHVDESVSSNAGDKRRLVDVVEASPWFDVAGWYETLDGPRVAGQDLNLSRFNRGDDGDAWPGFTAFAADSTDWVAPRDRDRFADDTIPSAQDRECNDTGIALENITLAGTDVIVDFVVGAKAGAHVAAGKSLTWSFETDADGFLFCNSYAHHDTDNGGSCPGGGGLWFGTYFEGTSCSSTAGYGNGWNDFSWHPIQVDAAGADVTIRHRYELEPGYDYAYLEVRCAGDAGAAWQQVASFDGESGCVTQTFAIPGAALSACAAGDGTAKLDLRLRMTSDGAWSTQDGDYCGIGWWVDELSVAGSVSGVDDTPGLGLSALLEPASPNPFNPTTALRFHVPAGARRASLRIYDQRGRLVRTLADGVAVPGWLEETWDGRDDAGRRQSSGVYFARLDVDGVLRLQKLALVK